MAEVAADPRRLIRHPETWAEFDQLRHVRAPYRPTYSEFDVLIDEMHRRLADAPRTGILIDIGIPGWLRVEDALKLYELSYFANGDILELGTSRGLSTYILASAIAGSGEKRLVTTVDLNPAPVQVAKNNIRERKLDNLVRFIVGDASEVMLDLRSRADRFSLCFVDHSHAYGPVALACRHLSDLIVPAGFVVFHDFLDRRNTRRKEVGESPDEYGVYAAVEDALSKSDFEFYGCYGCCGVFRRR